MQALLPVLTAMVVIIIIVDDDDDDDVPPPPLFVVVVVIVRPAEYLPAAHVRQTVMPCIGAKAPFEQMVHW